MNKYRLFIWTDFCRDYTPGLAFAIAKDETQARKMIIEIKGYNPSDWGSLQIKSLNKPIARCVSGGG